MRLEAAAVKESANIAQIIAGYGVQLKPAGPGDLVGLCPFHQEKTPSFTVTPEKDAYFCFGCSEGGDVIKFIQKIESVSFQDALTRVAELSGMSPTPQSTPRRSTGEPRRIEPQAEDSRQATVAANVRGKIVAVYPYVDEAGVLLYESCRIEPGPDGKKKTFKQRQPDGNGGYIGSVDGVRKVLYKLPDVIASDSVIFVEGEKDVQTLVGLGFVATTNAGGAAQKWPAEFTEFLRGKQVISIPDHDEPGLKRAKVIEQALSSAATEFVTIKLPAGKDITEFVEAGNSADDVRELIDGALQALRAERLEKRGLLTFTEMLQIYPGGASAFLDPSKRARGIPTGYADLDTLTLGLHAGELTIYAARPSMGKTALAICVAHYIASALQINVDMFSLEMSREQFFQRLVWSAAKVDSRRFRAGELYPDERSRAMRAAHELTTMPIWVDDTAMLDMRGMRTKLTRAQSERGLGVVIVDYLQLMSGDKKENRTQEVGGLSRGLKLMAKEFKVPVVVLSQLNRGPESRPGSHRPTLSDLRESGSIEQDADNVAFIFREEIYKPDHPELKGRAEIIYAKQRNGPIGTILLSYRHAFTRFENFTGGEPS